jgi:CheY-like chemotaxis protein
VLAVDDERAQRNFYTSVISEHKLFRVDAASSAREAEKNLRANPDYRLCILDFGIDDLYGDEFYLVKKYAGLLPVVVVSGARDMERAFRASGFGAAGLIEKPVDLFAPTFWKRVAEVFLNAAVLPSLPPNANTILLESCAVLRRQPIASVARWADSTGSTEAYLRRLWTESCGVSPKITLFLFNFYKEAFAYFTALFLSEFGDDDVAPRQPDAREHRRKIAYYNKYRKEIEGMLLRPYANAPRPTQ